MPLIISDMQTGFQKGRQMMESYVYTQQVLHLSRREKIPLALLKLDIRKAFDTISWEFTLKVMQKLDFPQKWINWIDMAIFRGSSQVLINGQLRRRLLLRRGVRQGNPLSPQLFIIAFDFLARYLQKLKDIGAIRLPFPAMRPCLLYVDDALLFF